MEIGGISGQVEFGWNFGSGLAMQHSSPTRNAIGVVVEWFAVGYKTRAVIE